MTNACRHWPFTGHQTMTPVTNDNISNQAAIAANVTPIIPANNW
jgi:hypothetical protein